MTPTPEANAPAPIIPLRLARMLLPGETVRPVPGASDYWASSTGRILSTKRGTARALKPCSPTGNPYHYVEITLDSAKPTASGRETARRTWRVHRIVLLAWEGLPHSEPGVTYDVHHIDGDPKNNAPSNLTYIDRAQHFMMSVAQGQHSTAKLTPQEVWVARCDAHREGTAGVVDRLVEEKGMRCVSVRRALRGETWGAVPMPRETRSSDEIARALNVEAVEAERLLSLSPFTSSPVRRAA